jgi:hypothetical protein
MLYVQICNELWHDPVFKGLVNELEKAFPKYQFLGICAIMWRFLSETERRGWSVEADRNETTKPSILKEQIATLAKKAIMLTSL